MARHHTTSEDLLAALLQGQQPRVQRTEELLGSGRELWDSDEELEELLAGIEANREESRRLARHSYLAPLSPGRRAARPR